MSSDALPDYTFCKELKGTKGPVNALIFSEDRKLLLSGGDDDCIRVWNTTTFKIENTLHSDHMAQVTVLTWVYIDTPIDDKCTMVAIGSGRGCVTLCPTTKSSSFLVGKEAQRTQIFAFNDAVEAMTYDRTNSRLAVSSHSGQIKMYTVDKSMVMKLVWTSSMSNAIPRALFFHGAANSLLMIIGLETGEICCREVESANVLWRKTLNGGIGNAALSFDQSTLIVDNLTARSFDVYTIPSTSRTASLHFSATPRYPKQCTFSEGARIAVCGSAVNKVHVVDVTTNEIIQTLTAGDDTEMMQTVAATMGNLKGALIAGGSSRGGIYLWKRIAQEREGRDDTSGSSTTALNGPQPRATGNDVVNPQVVILILLLTYTNWWPLLSQLATIAFAVIKSALQDIRTFL